MHRTRSTERGETSGEYLGLLVVVAAIVTALLVVVPLIPNGIADQIQCIIQGGGCEGGESAAPEAEDFTPDACQVASRETVDKGSVTVAIVHLGGDFSFARSERADGQTEITFVDLGALGLEAGAGGKFDVNSNGRSYGGSAEAEIKARLEASHGDTWVFDSPDEADDFEDWIRREKNEDRRGSMIPAYDLVNGAVEWATGEEDIPEPQITFEQVGLSAEAEAEAGAGVASAGAQGSAAVLVGSSHDRGDDRDSDADDQISDYYRVDFGLAGSAGVSVVEAGAGWSGQGVVKITRNADGEAQSIEIVDTSEGSLRGLVDLKADELTLEALQDKLKGSLEELKVAGDDASTHTVVATTTVDLETAEQRAVAEEWFGALSGITTAGERAADGSIVSSQDQVSSDFTELLYEDGRVSVVEYDGNRTGLSVAAEVALGVKLGGSVGTSTSESEAVEAYFLDAPSGGQRTLVPFSDCVAGG